MGYLLLVGYQIPTNPAFPHIGASPDAVVTDTTTNERWCVEIKCPFKLKNRKRGEPFYPQQTMPCTNWSGSCTNEYFAQTQMQMFLLGLSFCDFFVCSPTGVQLTRIPANPRFVSYHLLPAINHFYTCIFLPSVVWLNMGLLEQGNLLPHCASDDCPQLAQTREFQADALATFNLIHAAGQSTGNSHMGQTDFVVNGDTCASAKAEAITCPSRTLAILTIECNQARCLVNTIGSACTPKELTFTQPPNERKTSTDTPECHPVRVADMAGSITHKPAWWDRVAQIKSKHRYEILDAVCVGENVVRLHVRCT